MKKAFFAVFLVMVFSTVSAWASEIHVYGVEKRVGAVVTYLTTNGATATAHVGEEVMGQLNGKPWPGVRVSVKSTNDPHEGIFVPVSDKALSQGLCSDQKKLLNTYLPKKSLIIKPKSAKSIKVIPKIRPIADGDECDEESFEGAVTKAVIIFTGPNGGNEALELHDRPAKDVHVRYKVKRGYVINGEWVPAVWSEDGSCVRDYAAESFIETKYFNEVLLPGEKVELVLSENGQQFTDRGGNHNTEAVYIIQKDITAVAETSVQKSYTLTLPIGNQK